MEAQKSQHVLKIPDQTPPDTVKNKAENSTAEVDGVSIFQMFRFADNFDYLMMFVGTCGALALGAATPIFILFWGQFTDVFSSSTDQIVQMAWEVLKKFIYLGIGTLIAGWVMITCWLISGERQATVCRKRYFATLLKQEIGWFDCINQAELSSNFSADTLTFQNAVGEKIAVMIHVGGTFIAGFIIAFVKGWLMTLVCLAAFPIIAFSGFLYMQSLQKKSKQFQKIYSKAGGLAQQALFSIKTVKQLNGQQHEERRYQDCLADVNTNNLKFGARISASMAFMSGSMFLLYSLGYWYGSNCAEGISSCPPSLNQGVPYTAGNVITVFFAVLVGCFNLSQLSPALKKIGEGGQSAARIFAILDREPLIKNPENGLKPQTFSGNIRLQNVTFAYPKDKSRIILDDISIEFHISNTALVGQSGCGKSTILQMIMRFYDPDNGRILLDGNDLRELDLNWLRSKIGYVGQEPVLFATSIRQNLLLGNEHATEEEISFALKQAEAYDFVHNQLEDGLETYVGSGGGQISGGQKQRIAIARALLKNPKILLLDEATSALDRRNEKLIQHTLNKISQGLTTITVAHRIQSIMNANIIYVINKGKIGEKGKFKELERYKLFQNKELNEQEEIAQLQEKKQEPLVKEGDVTLQVLQKKTSTQKIIEKQKSKKQKEAEENAQFIRKRQEKQSIFLRVFGYMKQQRLNFAIGVLLTMVLGAIYPVFSIFLSNIINALFNLSNAGKQSQGRTDSNNASLAFLILAIATFIVTFLRDFLTYIVGDQITNGMRKEAYNKMLKMPIYWFDKEENNCGVLSTRLGTDCLTINGMATTYVYIMIQSLTTFVAGLVLALIYQWRTALVAIALMPIVMAAGAIRSAFRSGLSQKMDEAYKDSSQIIMESLNNIRTVVSFGVQNTVMHKYERYLDAPQGMLLKNSTISGLFFGLSQVTTFIVFGILFYIGTIFMRDYGVTLLDVFTAVYEVFFAGITIGNNSHFIPDMNEAKLAAAHIFDILDSQDEEQIQKRQQSKMLAQGIEGNIKLDNVSFKYDTRSQYVFKNMNIEILPGQKIAFVGPSGCGKSTIIQLLQRFYFPQSGKITIDGIDIKDFDIHYLRSKLGVVSQEPVLFNGSFRENIQYNKYDATEEEIRMAAKESNALMFIEGDQKLHNLEDTKEEKNQGFDRNVGMKGSHISGGQKQRVAIARAILRNPQILLLDEATSALDAQNEKKVQESLDSIMTSKTTISIAHRIDTIKNSDSINVFQKGEIVERGTYQSLIDLKGFFFNLERGTQFL